MDILPLAVPCCNVPVTSTLDGMARYRLFLMLLSLAIPAAAVAPRDVDMYIAVSSTEATDELALRVLEDQAIALGWRCSVVDAEKPLPQRNPLLHCRDGSEQARGGAVTAFHPLYESGPPKFALRGYRGSHRPDEVEALLRRVLDSMKSIAGVKVLEVDWNRGRR